MMKVVGLFRELSRNANHSVASIHSESGRLEVSLVNAVLTYLRSGIPVLDFMEATIDPLDSTRSIPGGPSLVSDGEWVWRHDLPYFVERYRVGLPDKFIECVLYEKTVKADRQTVIANWAQALDAYQRAELGEHG